MAHPPDEDPLKNELIKDDSQIQPLLRLHRASQSKFVGIERGRKDLRRIDDDHKRRRYTWSRLTRLNKRNYAFDNIRRRRPSVRTSVRPSDSFVLRRLSAKRTKSSIETCPFFPTSFFCTTLPGT